MDIYLDRQELRKKNRLDDGGAASHVSAKDMTMSLSLANQAKTPVSRHVNETSAKPKPKPKPKTKS